MEAHEIFWLKTLGEAALVHGTPPHDVLLERGKPLGLLTYLALSPGQRASRDELVELLWGDVAAERGRAALRQVIFNLRGLLGESSLISDGPYVRLTAAVSSACTDFLESIRIIDSTGAVQRYGGLFLPEFAVPGGRGFEDWSGAERVRLQSAFRRSAEAECTRLLDVGQTRLAVAVARKVRLLDPGSQGGWRA